MKRTPFGISAQGPNEMRIKVLGRHNNQDDLYFFFFTPLRYLAMKPTINRERGKKEKMKPNSSPDNHFGLRDLWIIIQLHSRLTNHFFSSFCTAYWLVEMIPLMYVDTDSLTYGSHDEDYCGTAA